MIARRLIPFLLALCIMAGLSLQTGLPVVHAVCRMTGQLMDEPFAQPKPSPTNAAMQPCCARTAQISANGSWTRRGARSSVIRSTSCCVFKASAVAPYAARTATFTSSDLFAVLPHNLPALTFAELPTASDGATSGQTPARAPPGHDAAAPRAPPTFS